MKRYGWIIVSVVILVVLGFFLWHGKSTGGPSVSETANPGKAPPSGMIAKIVKPTGTVKLTHDGQTNRAADGDVVTSTDMIETGPGSQVSIEWFSGARTALDANTKLTIDEATVDPGNWEKQRVRLTLSAGRVWSRILKLLDPSASYEVSYGGVVAGVRGTAFMLSGEPMRTPQDLVIDEFDGTVGASGKITGSLPAGFSVALDTRKPPADFGSLIQPTADDVRNDPWARLQLALDQDFATQAIKVRNGLGLNETLGTIGNEAGPYTLNQPGVVHSGFHTVQIINAASSTSMNPGDSTNLQALAVFIDDKTQKQTTKDVTGKATWQLSDPSLATIDSSGKLTAAKDAKGTLIVVARWNDTTHEHSGSMVLTIGLPGAAVLNTNATFMINGTPLK